MSKCSCECSTHPEGGCECGCDCAGPIYTLTVIRPRGEAGARTWTWFPTLDAAIESVTKDAGFYFEMGYYDHCVIEEVYSHSMGPHEQVAWFRADYADDKHTVVRLDGCPKNLDCIANWSLG